MAQITENLFLRGGYVDEVMSLKTFEELSNMPATKKFVGLTTTVKEALLAKDGKNYIPVDLWLSESRGNWVIKSIPPIDDLSQLDAIPVAYIPKGFRILLKDGTSYLYKNTNEEGQKQWELEVSRDEFESTIVDAVKLSVDEITSGASESFDTLKEIEEWINTHEDVIGKEGPQGPQGAQGDKGDTGAKGDRGYQGNQGPQGAQGAKGEDGAKGETGDRGYQGNQGPQGVQGANGKDGTSVTILGTFESEDQLPIDSNNNGDGYIIDGNLYVWTGFEWKNVGKIEGPQGAQGPQGASGSIDEESIIQIKDEIINTVKLTNGAGISIIDNQVNVLIENSDNENRNYLLINENNELSVETIGLDDAVTTEEILVNGGSWADEVNAVYGDKIPVGTSWQDFLKNMLCVEKFVDVITTSTAFTVSCGDLTPGIDKSGTVEVGTKVTLGKINANDTTAKQSLTAKTFTYGYKLGENGSHNSSTTYTETLTPIKVESNDALKVVFSKFVNNINDGTELEVINTNGSIDSIEMYAMDGSNSVSVYQTGDTYTSSSAVTAGTIYIATNLKNYYKSDKSTPNTYTPIFNEKTITASAKTTYSVIGAHKYYIGDIYDYSNDYWNANRSEEIRGLELKNWATGNTITVPYTFKEGTKQQTVVVPSVYNEVSGKDVNNGTVTFNFIKEINFHNSQGYISKFKVFVAPAIDGLGADSYITITIIK